MSNKKVIKKVLCLILSFIIVFTMIPTYINATDEMINRVQDEGSLFSKIPEIITEEETAFSENYNMTIDVEEERTLAELNDITVDENTFGVNSDGFDEFDSPTQWTIDFDAAYFGRLERDYIYTTFFEVYTIEELAAIAKFVNEGKGDFAGKTIFLKNDIVCDNSGISNDEFDQYRWTAIGNIVHPFRGTFDGCGYEITIIIIGSSAIPENTNTEYVGLFGVVDGGEIRNLGISSGSVIQFGVMQYAVENVPFYLGGIVSCFLNTGSIINCYNAGSIFVDTSDIFIGDSGIYIGGIIGYSVGLVNISNCGNTGNLCTALNAEGLSDVNIGGIVGYNEGSGDISNCYNTGDVSTSSSGLSYYSSAHYGNIGGILGYNSSGDINYCHNTGNISAICNNVGGIVGSIENNGNISNCYNKGNINLHKSNQRFTTIGGIAGFKNGIANIDNCYNDGNVSVNTEGGAYCGGVLGYSLDQGSIRNCYNNGDVSIDGDRYTEAGGILGYNESGSIENCHNNGAIYASSEYVYVGGVVGENSRSNESIRNCYNTGSVTAYSSYTDAYAGGISSSASKSIINCYNTGMISATSNVGSFAGGIAVTGTEIINCYNTGSVFTSSVSHESYSYAGGIAVGCSGTIRNCYNTGSVTASAISSFDFDGAFSEAGGIASSNNGSITNCYNAGAVTALTDSTSDETDAFSYAGGIVSINSGIVRYCYNIGSANASASSYMHSAFFSAGGIAPLNYGTISNCFYDSGIQIRPAITGEFGRTISLEESMKASNYETDHLGNNIFLNPTESWYYFPDGFGIHPKLLWTLTTTPIAPVLYGDVFSDGVIDSRDVVKLAQYLAGWPSAVLSDNELKAADTFADGVIDSKDIVKLAQYLAGWSVTLG